MSHELRTPLNAIIGFAQLLEMDELPPEQASSVDQIQVAGRHLLSLINEVLDISRIEAGRVSLSTEPVEVSEVLDEVITLLAPVAESAGVELPVDIGAVRVLRVRADRQRLLQVLLNLGSNAVKYNSRGGSVAFRTGPGGDGRVRFEVRDTGPGIPHEQQDQLFVPFSRLGAERSGVEGTGVGLAVSKQLVEVMGGVIGVDSLPATARRSGSNCCLRIPPLPTHDRSGRPRRRRRRLPTGTATAMVRTDTTSTVTSSCPTASPGSHPATGPAHRRSRVEAWSCCRSRTTLRTPPWSNRYSPSGPMSAWSQPAKDVRGSSWPANIGLTWFFSTSTCPTSPVTNCCTDSRPCLSWPTQR